MKDGILFVPIRVIILESKILTFNGQFRVLCTCPAGGWSPYKTHRHTSTVFKKFDSSLVASLCDWWTLCQQYTAPKCHIPIKCAYFSTPLAKTEQHRVLVRAHQSPGHRAVTVLRIAETVSNWFLARKCLVYIWKSGVNRSYL